MKHSPFAVCVLMMLLPTSAYAAGLPPDAIDLSQVHVYNSPGDVATWPVTTAITALHMRPNSDPYRGISLDFSARQTWPDYTPPGWDGPIQYTVWAVWYAAGQWNGAGIIQMWRSRTSTGAPLLEFDPGCSVNNFACNWVYDSRWGPGWGHQPVAGENMYFFVTAGDARGTKTATSVRERSNVVMVSLPANDTGDYTFPSVSRTVDFDGDGLADIAVYRPVEHNWYILTSSTRFTSGVVYQWGATGDIPIAADFDGDGRTDLVMYRPSEGNWYILLSSRSYQGGVVYQWGGVPGDVPVPGDYDGDGKTDLAIYRPVQGNWYIRWSSTNYSTGSVYQWGVATDTPVPADYDGDGKTDIAIYRPAQGGWYILYSSAGYRSGAVYQWGNATDKPVPADFDGDGKADLAIFRPSEGNWYIVRSGSGGVVYSWGIAGDVPLPADFDGDGKADLAVFRPSNAVWFGWFSSVQTGAWVQWGNSTDVPIRLGY